MGCSKIRVLNDKTLKDVYLLRNQNHYGLKHKL